MGANRCLPADCVTGAPLLLLYRRLPNNSMEPTGLAGRLAFHAILALGPPGGTVRGRWAAEHADNQAIEVPTLNKR
jgi:hypothetical protein